jgi:hypothetical protein
MSGRVTEQRNQTKKLQQTSTKISTSDNTKTVEPEPQATVKDRNVVKIPELGIQITVKDTIKDLTYEANVDQTKNKYGQIGAFAYFSTAALTALDAGCGPDDGPLGAISTIQGQYPGDPKTQTTSGNMEICINSFQPSTPL